jgi:hypothetical protein
VVAIGRVIIGDVAATLVDLAVRGYLAVEQDTAADHGDWLLTRAGAGHRSDSLLEYEQILLSGLPRDATTCRLSALAGQFPETLDRMRTAVTQDAVHRGWLKHLHHDERTEQGEELAMRIRAFQRELRSLKSTSGTSALDGRLLPYALHFGLAQPDQDRLVSFAHAWRAMFADLPGWRPPERKQAPVPSDSDQVSKASIDEQMMDPTVGLGVWLAGG